MNSNRCHYGAPLHSVSSIGTGIRRTCHNSKETPGSVREAWPSGKLEGSDTALVFLGFELDTTVMEVRLPQHKLVELKQQWQGKKACSTNLDDLPKYMETGNLDYIGTVLIM